MSHIFLSCFIFIFFPLWKWYLRVKVGEIGFGGYNVEVAFLSSTWELQKGKRYHLRLYKVYGVRQFLKFSKPRQKLCVLMNVDLVCKCVWGREWTTVYGIFLEKEQRIDCLKINKGIKFSS